MQISYAVLTLEELILSYVPRQQILTSNNLLQLISKRNVADFARDLNLHVKELACISRGMNVYHRC